MKSKIKIVHSIKPTPDQYGNKYYCLEMENGDKIEIGKKKEQQPGWELSYEITGQGQEYNKAKSVQDDNFTPNTQTQQPPQSQHKSNFNRPDVQDDILYSVCLKGSMDFYLQYEEPLDSNQQFTPHNICSMALELAKQAKIDIKTLKQS